MDRRRARHRPHGDRPPAPAPGRLTRGIRPDRNLAPAGCAAPGSAGSPQGSRAAGEGPVRRDRVQGLHRGGGHGGGDPRGGSAGSHGPKPASPGNRCQPGPRRRQRVEHRGGGHDPARARRGAADRPEAASALRRPRPAARDGPRAARASRLRPDRERRRGRRCGGGPRPARRPRARDRLPRDLRPHRVRERKRDARGTCAGDAEPRQAARRRAGQRHSVDRRSRPVDRQGGAVPGGEPGRVDPQQRILQLRLPEGDRHLARMATARALPRDASRHPRRGPASPRLLPGGDRAIHGARGRAGRGARRATCPGPSCATPTPIPGRSCSSRRTSSASPPRRASTRSSPRASWRPRRPS